MGLDFALFLLAPDPRSSNFALQSRILCVVCIRVAFAGYPACISGTFNPRFFNTLPLHSNDIQKNNLTNRLVYATLSCCISHHILAAPSPFSLAWPLLVPSKPEGFPIPYPLLFSQKQLCLTRSQAWRLFVFQRLTPFQLDPLASSFDAVTISSSFSQRAVVSEFATCAS